MSDNTFSMGTSFNTSGSMEQQAATPQGLPSAPAQAPAGPVIKESDTASFMADVIETSRSVPVIVDFWAPWCGPCKQLGPALEKVVQEAGGKVRMVKINVDTNQQLAQQMRIQSIPAVFAFADGQPVDGFMGALPESELKSFVDKLVKGHGGLAAQLDELFQQADEAIQNEAWEQAMAMFGAAMQAAPEDPRAIAGQIKCLIGMEQLEEARAVADALPENLKQMAEISGALAALEVAETPVDNAEINKLREAVERDGKDHASRLDLAIALNAAGQREEALDQVLAIIEADRAWNDEAARKQLLTFFEAWGPMDELTVAGRRRLSSILFA
ncbi:MAG: thioredoxin [Anderseniella sp.]|jgi:putative thioredoxin|nr:thioredoxin [Anderseniella sp.]